METASIEDSDDMKSSINTFNKPGDSYDNNDNAIETNWNYNEFWW